MLALHPLPAFTDNYIWRLAGSGGACVVVDPGEAGPVLRALDGGLRPVAILLTHHHADHIGGVAGLIERVPMPVLAPEDARIPLASERVSDGQRRRIDALGVEIEVVAVPGHTRTHVAYRCQDLLFCGDALFSLGCGRLFEGTPAQALASLDRLAALPETTRVCCAHEYSAANARFALAVDPDNPALRQRAAEIDRQRAAGQPSLPTSIAAERASNPFLRCDAPSVRNAIGRRLGRPPRDRLECFAELRRFKDTFVAT